MSLNMKSTLFPIITIERNGLRRKKRFLLNRLYYSGIFMYFCTL